mgnify:CR=1 FL=1
MSDTMEMQLAVPQTARAPEVADRSIGRIVSVVPMVVAASEPGDGEFVFQFSATRVE